MAVINFVRLAIGRVSWTFFSNSTYPDTGAFTRIARADNPDMDRSSPSASGTGGRGVTRSGARGSCSAAVEAIEAPPTRPLGSEGSVKPKNAAVAAANTTNRNFFVSTTRYFKTLY